MIRLLVRMAVYFAAAAIGLLVASLVFDGVDVDTVGFLVVAAIYAVVLGLLTPLFTQQAERRRASALVTSGVGVVTTFVALVVTDLISDDLTIEGFTTWIGATLVVWLATLLATLLLPVLVVKHVVDERHRS